MRNNGMFILYAIYLNKRKKWVMTIVLLAYWLCHWTYTKKWTHNRQLNIFNLKINLIPPEKSGRGQILQSQSQPVLYICYHVMDLNRTKVIARKPYLLRMTTPMTCSQYNTCTTEIFLIYLITSTELNYGILYVEETEGHMFKHTSLTLYRF